MSKTGKTLIIIGALTVAAVVCGGAALALSKSTLLPIDTKKKAR